MLENWDKAFSQFEPVSYQLKHKFRERWVRFHHLPESKRYPDSETDFQTLLTRHNELLAELASTSSAVVLLTTEYSFSEVPRNVPDESPTETYWRSVKIDDDIYWHVYATTKPWKHNSFDTILRLVANDELPNVMICDLECDWIFHPYDGGMDIVLRNREMGDLLKSCFNDWLSERADGL